MPNTSRSLCAHLARNILFPGRCPKVSKSRPAYKCHHGHARLLCEPNLGLDNLRKSHKGGHGLLPGPTPTTAMAVYGVSARRVFTNVSRVQRLLTFSIWWQESIMDCAFSENMHHIKIMTGLLIPGSLLSMEATTNEHHEPRACRR